MESARLCKPARGLDIIEAVNPRRIAACVALCTTLLFSEKHFSPPPAAHASTYALHETHSDEKVTIAADPCDTPGKAGKNQARRFQAGWKDDDHAAAEPVEHGAGEKCHDGGDR
jgi:hypothetical protein